MTNIKLIEGGPAIVHPSKEDYVHMEYGTKRHEKEANKPIAICRCGRSLDFPFCDGSHDRKPAEIESNLS